MLEYYLVNVFSFLTALILSMIFGGFIATRKWCQKLFIKVTGEIVSSDDYYNMVKEMTVKSIKIGEDLVKDISSNLDDAA